MGRSRQQELEASGQVTATVRKQRVMTLGVALRLLWAYSLGSQPGRAHPLWAGLPVSVKSANNSRRLAQRPVLLLILSSDS